MQMGVAFSLKIIKIIFMRNSIPTTIHYPVEKNRVLDKNFRASDNFFRSDKIFGNYFKNNISSTGAAYMNDKLDSLGNDAAGIMNELCMAADKKRTSAGKTQFVRRKY